jgi:hypothetical protein
MKKKRILFSLLAVVFGFLLSANDLFALPIADFVGASWSYTHNVKVGSGASATYVNTLTLSNATVSLIDFLDGTYTTSDAVDPLIGASIYVGGDLTSPGDKTSPPPGEPFTAVDPGGVGSFTVTEGGNTYLTGTLSTPIDFNPIGTGYTRAVITVTDIDTSMDTSGSRYISEIAGLSELTFDITLAVTSGNNLFTMDSSGSYQGKLIGAATAVPEPSSLVLLVSGMLGLVITRRNRAK